MLRSVGQDRKARTALWLVCALALGACDASNSSEADDLQDTPFSAQVACTDGGTEPQPDAGPGGPVDYREKGPLGYVIEKNTGTSFRNANVGNDTALCNLFIGLIGNAANGEVNKELTTYPADMDRQLYTLYRPQRWEAGKKYPVITWGNGTCAQPLLYEELLGHLASHGFIVIAANTRWVSAGTEMRRGLDFVLAENARAGSSLYGKVDVASLGVSGHSQGSMAAASVAGDARIVASVPIQGAGAAAVGAARGPMFLIAGEKDDIVAPAGIETAFRSARVPAVYGLSLGQDHLMPGTNPTPILREVTSWFKLHLAKEESVRSLFYGPQCGLCSDPAWKIQRRNIQ